MRYAQNFLILLLLSRMLKMCNVSNMTSIWKWALWRQHPDKQLWIIRLRGAITLSFFRLPSQCPSPCRFSRKNRLSWPQAFVLPVSSDSSLSRLSLLRSLSSESLRGASAFSFCPVTRVFSALASTFTVFPQPFISVQSLPSVSSYLALFGH